MVKKLDNIAAARETTPHNNGVSDYLHHSVSVRKIDNGFVKTVTRSGGAGGYESKETFHRKHPGVKEGLSPRPMGPSTLKDAVAVADGGGKNTGR